MSDHAASDGYVTCDDCGHPLERHDRKGCHGTDGCTCPVRITAQEIGEVRIRLGLPRRWKRSAV